jgi:2-C-methyl-D-erythritol 4-phosphate cytidylyltransferase
MVNLKKFAIIVAGGVGTRMNAGIPKQFLLLGGKPVLMHSMEAFPLAYPDISIILVLPASQFSSWQSLCEQHLFTLPHQVVAGGETRFHSVKNALSAIGSDGVVAIHDGVRPLISVSLIREGFLSAGQLGNCIPVVPVNESLRMLENGGSHAVGRSEFCMVQTPQVFRCNIIKKAYEQAYRESFTDDATVAESIGEVIHLIDGDPVNLKITHPSDLAAAEAIFRSV